MGAAGKGWWKWACDHGIERPRMNYKAYGMRMDMNFDSWVTALRDLRMRPGLGQSASL